MPFIYHAVPRGMVGETLVPLTALATVSPAAFELQRSKYTHREAVLDARVTASGLLFNDTVHCAPLHPHHLYRLRARLGLLPKPPTDGKAAPWMPGLFFEIPVERIRFLAAYWYRWQTPWINGYPDEDVPAAPPMNEFEPFDSTRYRELSAVPPAHIAYLERRKADGKPSLMFVHIPHVLVSGEIDAGDLRQINWEDDPIA